MMSHLPPLTWQPEYRQPEVDDEGRSNGSRSRSDRR
jgi:hypothetical protein